VRSDVDRKTFEAGGLVRRVFGLAVRNSRLSMVQSLMKLKGKLKFT
jgi:hypothetical protein